jgi:hypothetical protein
MKHVISFIVFCLFFFSCDEDDPEILPDRNTTAKQQVPKVINKARAEFSADANLSAIYGRDVSVNGTVDLLSTSGQIFVYVVQSDIQGGNELYVPVYNSDPIQSPINFNTMLSLIQDSTARGIVGTALGTLASVSIDPSVQYDDSPWAVNIGMQNGGSTFLNQNTNSRIDLFLLPSKSIDTTSVSNTADWIVNFNSESESLVLWIHSGTGNVTVLSQ